MSAILFKLIGIGTAVLMFVAAAQAQTAANAQSEGSTHMQSAQSFAAWRDGFRGRAVAQGVSPALFDKLFATIAPDEKIIALDRNQGEFTRSIWQYLDSAVSNERVKRGRDMLRANAAQFAAIEASYGVDKEVLAAIWGIETNYGSFRGTTPTLVALATLAYDGRRAAFFERELIAALRIIQNGDISASAMRGSWAGAMGHTQFMPTSWWELAVDFDGDGRRDVWGADPSDALASSAHYLRQSGWQPGAPWALEVRLPKTFNYALAARDAPRTMREWHALGLRDMTGKALPSSYGKAALLLPAGAEGPAFLTFQNFKAIARYNGADAYVFAVGHLSDRLRGEKAFRTPWPRHHRALSRDEKTEFQRRLSSAGFDTQGIDGKFGPNSAGALKKWQIAHGLVADGFATLNLLNTLRVQQGSPAGG